MTPRTPFVATLAALCWLATPVGALAADPVADAFSASYVAEANNDIPAALKALSGVQTEGEATYVLALRQGWLHYLAGTHADAVAAYGNARRIRPASVEAILGQTLPLMAQKRWTDTRTACLDALKLEPTNATAEARLAWAHYSAGQYDQAAARYQGLVARYPSDPDFRAGLGWALLKLGRTAPAATAFDTVLRFAPDHASAKAGKQAL